MGQMNDTKKLIKNKIHSLDESLILQEIEIKLQNCNTSKLYHILLYYCKYYKIKEIKMISHRNKIIDFILETPLNGEKVYYLLFYIYQKMNYYPRKGG